ncbi:MAG: invasion associated locus B family protein [Devosiaceae bacterium]|nr:invasion associated locus B family protein [Devosiaceae bacterium MH13]
MLSLFPHRPATRANIGGLGRVAALAVLIGAGLGPAAAQDQSGEVLTPEQRLQQIIESVDPAEAEALADSMADLQWMKVCGVDQRINQTVCNIRARELQIEGVTVGGLQIIEGEAGERRMVAILPTRLQLPEGVRGQVDDGGQISGTFRICYPQNCVVEFEANDALINSFKAGGEFTVTALNEAGRAVPFAFSLSGFTSAYDGEGYESALLIAAEQILRQRAVAQQGEVTVEDSDDLQQALEQRAREVRERIQE